MTKRTGNIIHQVSVFLLILFLIWPFLYVLSSSFKTLAELMTDPRFFPREITTRNYETLMRITPLRNFPQIVSNSLFVGVFTALATLVISCFAAYGLSRNRKLATGFIPRSLLFIYVFPTIIIVVPIYQMMVQIGLYNNLVSLIIIYTALAAPFCTWLLISFFMTVPIQLEESAQIDGAGWVTIFTRIIIPLTAPGLLTVGMYAFILSWGEYLFALVLIESSSRNTAPLGLARYTTEQYIEWGPLLAGSVVIMIPVILIFIPLAKLFIKGFIAGALKG